MSQSAQSIITSHRAAAARAVEHFKKTRGWRLSLSESLELVACVLGQPNWNTLQALAKQGKDPRVTTEVALPLAGETPCVATRLVAPSKERFTVRDKEVEHVSSAIGAHGGDSQNTVEQRPGGPQASRLAAYYAGKGLPEDPWFTKENYLYLQRPSLAHIMGARTYWEWVEQGIAQSGAMFPWERDALPSKGAFRDSGCTVAPAYPGWWLVDRTGAPVFPEVKAFEKEASAWAHATEWLGKEIVRGIKEAMPSGPGSTAPEALGHLFADEWHLRPPETVVQDLHGQNLKYLGRRRPPQAVFDDPYASAAISLEEDPLFTRASWRSELQKERPGDNYWEWVLQNVEKIGAMLWWEREAESNVSTARRHGLRPIRTGIGWMVVRADDGSRAFPGMPSYDKEALAWQRAVEWALHPPADGK